MARRSWFQRVAWALIVLPLAAGCRSVEAPDPLLLADLGQLLLVGFAGTRVAGNADVERLLCQVRVGGVVLFEQPNITGPEQLGALTADLQRRARDCTGRPLLIAADAEGGRIMRLSPRVGWEPTLSHRELGEANDLALTRLEAQRIGFMLANAGINWNFAPVVDVGYNPANPVIVGRGRSFAANPFLVTAHARAYLEGMRAAGILTALKHFPGHGSSYADSHDGFVDVTATADPAIELVPYRAILREGSVDAVMTAHVFNRTLDPRHPATLSRATVTGLLRRQLGFTGVIVSDDMRMGAIARHYGVGEAAVLALAAGVDTLLITEDRLDDGGSASEVALVALREAVGRGRLAPATVAAALDRVARLKARLPVVARHWPCRTASRGTEPRLRQRPVRSARSGAVPQQRVHVRP
jgi:beta-N-acetylhexosaminidase